MNTATAAAPATPVVASFPTTLKRADLPHLGELVPEFGGVFAALMRGKGESPDYALIVTEAAVGEKVDVEFGNYGKRVTGADDDTDGLANTIALVNSGIAHPAAQFCRDLVIDGINDFYLPARHELRACYLNVPALFNPDDWYWSSTQYAGGHSYAWGQYFDDGGQIILSKDYEGRCRAVRRLVIS